MTKGGGGEGVKDIFPSYKEKCGWQVVYTQTDTPHNDVDTK